MEPEDILKRRPLLAVEAKAPESLPSSAALLRQDPRGEFRQAVFDLMSAEELLDYIRDVGLHSVHTRLERGAEADPAAQRRNYAQAFALLVLVGELQATVGRRSLSDRQRLRHIPTPATERMRDLIGLAAGPINPQSVLACLRAGADRIIDDLVDLAMTAGGLVADEHEARRDGRRLSEGALAGALDADPLGSQSRSLRPLDMRRTALAWRGPATPEAPRAAASSRTSTPPPPLASTAADLQPWQDRAADLARQVAQLEGQLRDATERSLDEGTAAQTDDLVRSLRARLQWLEVRLEQSQVEADPPEELPQRWEDLPAYVDRHLAGRLVLARKALKAAMRSLYEDVPFAARALDLLGRAYVPMRLGEPGARERFDRWCLELGVAVGPVGEAVRDHRYRAAYQVRHLGHVLPLDLHIQGNDSRDQREGFRLYFSFYQPADGAGYAVVGHLPTHLDNSLS